MTSDKSHFEPLTEKDNPLIIIASVTFLYSSMQPSADLSLPDVKSRKIFDPDKIVFVPGWNVPIHS